MSGKQLVGAVITALFFAQVSPAHAQNAYELEFRSSVKDSGSAAQLQLYIDEFPDGKFRKLAFLKLGELSGALQPIGQTNAQITASDAQRCDALAGHSNDTTLGVNPTSFADLKSHVDRALAACRAAAQSNESRQLYQLGRTLLAAEQVAEANENILRAAELGHAQANYYTGVNHITGPTGALGLPKDTIRAAQYLQRAYDLGMARAGAKLGKLYATGDGVARDRATALAFYLDAEAGGATEVCYDLAFLFAEDEHWKSARQRLETCLAEGHFASSSHNLMGRMLVLGKLGEGFHDRNEFPGFGENMIKGMAHLEEGLGDRRARHDFMITQGFDIVAAMHRTLDTASIGLRDSRAYLATRDGLITMHDSLAEIIDARSAMFSNDLPDHTAAFVADEIGRLQSVVLRKLDAIANYNDLLAPIKDVLVDQDGLAECVTTNTNREGRYLHVTLRNYCAFSVSVWMRYQVRVVDAGGFKIVQKKTWNLAPDEKVTTTIDHKHPRHEISRAVSVEVCPTLFREIVANSANPIPDAAREFLETAPELPCPEPRLADDRAVAQASAGFDAAFARAVRALERPKTP